MTIGDRIKSIRKEKKMSQFQVERKSQIKREYICKIETGGLPNPTAYTLEKIADALGVTLVYLIDGVRFRGAAEDAIPTSPSKHLGVGT